jgi:CTP:molybdopterin cytidylyltransferase MocA
VTGRPAGIVLAGGEGRRFGQAKAMVRFAGRPLVERAVETFSAGGCAPLIVVLGARADEVERTCDLSGALVVHNDNWAEGMSASLRVGLDEARRDGAPAAVITPVDQPAVLPALVARLVQRWGHGSAAVVAAFGGAPRTPVLLDASLWPDVVETAVGDRGARAFLRAHPELVDLVDCDDVGDAADLDRPEDLATVEAAWSRLGAGHPVEP